MQRIEAPTRTKRPTPLVSPKAAYRHGHGRLGREALPAVWSGGNQSFEQDAEVRGADQQTERNVPLFDLVHLLAADLYRVGHLAGLGAA
jgi:hypothetical protein